MKLDFTGTNVRLDPTLSLIPRTPLAYCLDCAPELLRVQQDQCPSTIFNRDDREQDAGRDF